MPTVRMDSFACTVGHELHHHFSDCEQSQLGLELVIGCVVLVFLKLFFYMIHCFVRQFLDLYSIRPINSKRDAQPFNFSLESLGLLNAEAVRILLHVKHIQIIGHRHLSFRNQSNNKLTLCHSKYQTTLSLK